METQGPVITVATADFATEVLDRSRTVPVVVDFWATWCAPCLQLSPVLEELALAGAGRWILAKVDVEANPELAQELGVSAVPTVVAFVAGRPVDRFSGNLPRAEIEEFLGGFVPTAADDLAARALATERAGDRDGEKALLDQALELDPHHEASRLRRARWSLLGGDLPAARADLAEVAADSPLRQDAENLAVICDWTERVGERGDLEAIRARAGEDPDAPAHRFDLGCALALRGEFEDAFAEFLAVVGLDRAFEDDAGRRAMLALFSLLGNEHELTRTYRDRLSALLF
jgi:putative thioredoxin